MNNNSLQSALDKFEVDGRAAALVELGQTLKSIDYKINLHNEDLKNLTNPEKQFTVKFQQVGVSLVISNDGKMSKKLTEYAAQLYREEIINLEQVKIDLCRKSKESW